MADEKTPIPFSHRVQALNDFIDEPDLDVESMDPALVRRELEKDGIDLKASFAKAQQTFSEARARGARAKARDEYDRKRNTVSAQLQRLRERLRSGERPSRREIIAMFPGQHFRKLEAMTDEDVESLLDDQQIFRILEDEDDGSGA